MNHQINIFDGNNNRIKLERVALNYTFLFDLGQMMFLFTSDSKEQLNFFQEYYKSIPFSYIYKFKNKPIIIVRIFDKKHKEITESIDYVIDSEVEMGNLLDDSRFIVYKDFSVVVKGDVIDIFMRKELINGSQAVIMQKCLESCISYNLLTNGYLPIHATIGIYNFKKIIVLGSSNSGKTSFFEDPDILFDEIIYTDGRILFGLPYIRRYINPKNVNRNLYIERYEEIFRSVQKINTSILSVENIDDIILLERNFDNSQTKTIFSKMSSEKQISVFFPLLRSIPGNYFFPKNTSFNGLIIKVIESFKNSLIRGK